MYENWYADFYPVGSGIEKHDWKGYTEQLDFIIELLMEGWRITPPHLPGIDDFEMKHPSKQGVWYLGSEVVTSNGTRVEKGAMHGN